MIALSTLASGCTPSTPTGDEIIDKVVWENDPSGKCVAVDGPTRISTAGDTQAPPGLLTPESFKNPEIKAAAKAIATPWRDWQQVEEKPKIFGTVAGDRCMMAVSSPANSGSYVFVEFITPGGLIGAYALERDLTGWRIVESVRLGYW